MEKTLQYALLEAISWPKISHILSVTGCAAKTAEHDPITLPENWHKHCTNDIWKSSLDDLQGAKRRGGNHEDGWQLCELIHLSSFIILYFVYIRFYIYIWGITVCIYIHTYYVSISIYICMYLCSSQFPILQDQKPQHHPVLGNREPPGVDSFPTQLCEAEEPLKMQWIPGWPWCIIHFDRWLESHL